MDSDHGDLSHVLDRFPDRAQAIVRLAEVSESFRSLCDDYLLGLVVFGQLKASERADREVRIEEYRAILHGLEQEIETALAEPEIRDDPSHHR